MRLLLDSHVALWALGDPGELSDECSHHLRGADEVYFSAVTPWELGIKRAKGTIIYPDDLVGELAACGFEELPITAAHADAATRLPPHHADPFDRMLVAQAQAESLTLVTADRQLLAYDVPNTRRPPVSLPQRPLPNTRPPAPTTRQTGAVDFYELNFCTILKAPFRTGRI